MRSGCRRDHRCVGCVAWAANSPLIGDLYLARRTLDFGRSCFFGLGARGPRLGAFAHMYHVGPSWFFGFFALAFAPDGFSAAESGSYGSNRLDNA